MGKRNLIKYLLVVTSCLILIIFLCVALLMIFTKDRNELLKNATENSVAELKNELLNADNISLVTTGVALGIVPFDAKIDYSNKSIKEGINFHDGTINGNVVFIGKEKTEMSDSFPSYDFLFYEVNLTDNQYDEFIRYHKKKTYSQLPFFSSDPFREDILLGWEHQNEWRIYQLGDEILLTKNYFACFIPNAQLTEGRWQPIAYPPFMAPMPTKIKCSYIKNSKENTKEEVATFIKEALEEAGINCQTTSCEINDASTKSIQINEYGRQIKYSRERFFLQRYLKNISEQQKTEARKQADSVFKYFKKARWKAIFSEEKKRMIQLRVEANNNKYTCRYVIAFDYPQKVLMGLDYKDKEPVYIDGKSVAIRCHKILP